MYSSQSCENFFRHLRNMSTTSNTVVNCSVLSAIQQLKRIQFLSDITSFDFPLHDQEINFPRTRFLNASYEKQDKVYNEIPQFDDSVTILNIKK